MSRRPRSFGCRALAAVLVVQTLAVSLPVAMAAPRAWGAEAGAETAAGAERGGLAAGQLALGQQAVSGDGTRGGADDLGGGADDPAGGLVGAGGAAAGAGEAVGGTGAAGGNSTAEPGSGATAVMGLGSDQLDEIRAFAEQASGNLDVDGAEPVLSSVPGLDPQGGKSAATPQVLALPTAEGSVQGMGESFAPVLSAGTATYSVPIALPPGRAGVAPKLALSYGSSSGNSPVGFGWSLEASFIGRQADRGLPRYVDKAAWHAEEDRFFYNGGQELVPVANASAELEDCGVAGCAPVPAELTGWQQYRARVEGGYLRFFRAPGGRSWVVQGKDGSRLDFGVVSDGPASVTTGSVAALQSEADGGSGRIYRWLLTRSTDPHGSTTYYQYNQDHGQRYLADIYYLSPQAECGILSSAAARMRCTAPLAAYGRRVKLTYETRPDAYTSYTSGWAITTALRLRRIDITAAPGAAGARTLVRRYHLGYDVTSFYSQLASVQLEGRPHAVDAATGAMVGDASVPEASLGNAIVGPLLPPIRFYYSSQPTSGPQISGFGGINATTHSSPASPPHSVDEARADLFDVNSDGLPDLIVTDPATYALDDGAPAVGVFFNGFHGDAPAAAAGTFSSPVRMPVPAGFGNVMTLANLNIVPMDLDGDGRGDLLHMPRVANYAYFAATLLHPEAALPIDQGWEWSYEPRRVPDGETDPRIDLANDSPSIRAVDVNNDHLIDVVRTTGTQMQTWLNLGWVPNGDGSFGTATYSSATGTWQLSTKPIASCLLYASAGQPIDFADSQVRFGDMNGDGIQDIVKMQPGRIIYWPGRGVGLWGEGAASCPATPGAGIDRHVEMASPPAELNVEMAGVYLSDVNADGADDVVQVRYGAVDVWFNRTGSSFTSRVIASGTPYAPAYAPRIRMTDIDGSGTVDVVYANAGNWQWVDLMGGQRPRLLTEVRGSLGAQTDITYGSSIADYLADLRDAAACGDPATCEAFTWSGQPVADCDGCPYRSGGSPVVSTVVRSVATSDRMDAFGLAANVTVTNYAYHDGYYDGVEQEFRGFGAADAEAVGDATHPTSFTRTYFHQGRRPYGYEHRLDDNPREALKGLAYLTEVSDSEGRFFSTAHQTYTLRKLHTGLNGVAVADTFPSQADELRYDMTDYSVSETTMSLPGLSTWDGGAEEHQIRVRATEYAQLRTTIDTVDGVGNVTFGTKHGRVHAEEGEAVYEDEAIVSHTTFANIADVASGDGMASGWQWRPTVSYTTDAWGSSVFGHTTRTYNANGDEILNQVAVDQPETYSFGDLGSPSPEPLLAATSFDGWGNPTAACAGGATPTAASCLRFRQTSYDADYAAFAETESVAVRRNGASYDFLTSSGDWDRGLGAITVVEDPNGEQTSVSYDGFGRLTAVTPPPVEGTLCDGGQPATLIEYLLPADSAASPLSRVYTTTYTSCAGEALEAIAFVDGLGRVRAQLATGDDYAERAWVKSGVAVYDARGAVRYAYQAVFYAGADSALGAVLAIPGVGRTETKYDALGRVRFASEANDDTTETRYHALRTDVWDPLDRGAGIEAGTFTTTRVDGHGRTIDTVLRNRQPDAQDLELYRLLTSYRQDGAVQYLGRVQTADDLPAGQTSIVGGRVALRYFIHDSVGRRIAATEPVADVMSAGGTWSYLFNRVGDLVAVRDPRGCGQDFYYDHAGRLLGEKYVGCTEAQVHEGTGETVPAGAISLSELAAPQTAHVRHLYDSYTGAWGVPATLEAFPTYVGGVLGRETAVADRGQRSLMAYDQRGNLIWVARQMAVIPDAGLATTTVDPVPPTAPPDGDATPAAGGPVVYDEGHTYVTLSAYDHANRERGIILPPDPDFDGEGAGPVVAGRLTFNRRGLPRSAVAVIAPSGSWPSVDDGQFSWAQATPLVEQTVIAEMDYERDGLVHTVTYGDDDSGSRQPTVSTTTYEDLRRRPTTMQVVRVATGAGGSGERPLAAVTVPFAQELTWDAASNLVGIADERIATEWPAGHRPRNITADHDALYRVTSAVFEYSQDDTSLGGDVGSDWRTEMARTLFNDPMWTQPAPHLGTVPATRVADLEWKYDWLGNMNSWTEVGDASAFYERSIGNITNGADVTGVSPALRPGALYLAADLDGVTATNRGGYLEVDYGQSGNVVAMTVRAQCADLAATCADPGGTDLASRRATMRANCLCASEQHYQYRWDELNRLAEARRYDRTGGSGLWQLAVRQRYRYDGANQRTVKQTLEGEAGGGGPSPPAKMAPATATATDRGGGDGTGQMGPGGALPAEAVLVDVAAIGKSAPPTGTLDGGMARKTRLLPLAPIWRPRPEAVTTAPAAPVAAVPALGSVPAKAAEGSSASARVGDRRLGNDGSQLAELARPSVAAPGARQGLIPWAQQIATLAPSSPRVVARAGAAQAGDAPVSSPSQPRATFAARLPRGGAEAMGGAAGAGQREGSQGSEGPTASEGGPGSEGPTRTPVSADSFPVPPEELGRTQGYPIAIPPVPTNLAPTGNIHTSQQFSWKGSLTALSYEMVIGGKSRTWTPSALGCAAYPYNCTTPAISVAAGTSGNWSVRAWNSSGWSAWTYAAYVVATPAAPTGLSPVGNAHTSQVFTWNASAYGGVYATSYRFYISGVYDQVWTAAERGCSAGGTCTSPAMSLGAGTSGTWQVRGINSYGEGVYASASYTVATPPVPTDLSPSGNAATTQVFSWTGASTATSYQLQLNANPVETFTPSQVYCVGGGNCHTTKTLAAGTSGTWTVRGVNDYGNGPLASASYVVATPPAPTGLAPSGNATTSQVFSWGGWTSSVDAYRFYIAGSYDQTISASELECTTISCHTGPMALEPGKTGTWKVAAIDNEYGQGVWASAPYTVPTPAAPTVLTPSGAVATSQIFAWKGNGNASSYELKVGTVFNQTYAAADLGTSCAAQPYTCAIQSPVSLEPGTSGTWSVRGINTYGAGLWASAPYVVATPAAPTGLSPAGNVATSQVFSWTLGESNVFGYRFYIEGVYDQVFTIGSGGFSCDDGICRTPAMALDPGTSGSWKIRAINPYGEGLWSSPVAYTVAAPPAPTELAPTGYLHTSEVFSWTGDAGADWYQFFISGRYDETWAAADVGCLNGGICHSDAISLPAGARGDWYVRGISDEYGAGLWASAAFVVATPPAPSDLVPNGNAHTSQLFSWSAAIHAASATTTYELAISGHPNQTISAADLGCVSGGTCTTPAPAIALAPGETGTWSVRATNEYGTGPWSATTAFTVATPDPPTALAPSGFISTAETLTWHAAAGATSYRLFIEDVGDYTWTAAEVGCDQDESCATPAAIAFPARTRGYWLVAAINQYGASAWASAAYAATIGAAGEERIALYVYPGDVERRGLTRSTAGDSYLPNPDLPAETQYLVAGARLVWKTGDPLVGLDVEHRFTLALGDLIGTTSAVLDLRSGELIEVGSYYPNGARETYLTSSQADVPAEPAGFTGKEADEEVGLVYFGERYLIPRIGRWASADPLEIHAVGGGEALNDYHYVGGNLLQGRDPVGLRFEWLAEKWDNFTSALIVADDRYKITQRSEGARKVFEGVGIAGGGCGTGAGCVVAVGLGAARAGEGVHELISGRDQPNAAEVIAGPEGGEVLDAAIAAYSAVQTGFVIYKGLAGRLPGFAGKKHTGTAELDGRSPVRPGDTGTYGELRKQKSKFGETEPLDMDHQPSLAAQVAAKEQALGRKLTPKELCALKKNTPAVASPREVHQQTSPTYGGRNTPTRVAEDAADLDAAGARDRAVFDEAMRAR